ncbi:TIR domain-containing protein [Actinoplanes sp. NPDC051859]|uniref:TIR domain-containing protein n=1 Tax=Actinoplanes sp. NPDC051859 TaxID=3363909 RepID=UPI0037B13C60
MRFDGFISYSHAADGRLAPAVQRGLHRLAKPWHRRRALWIFRDQTGLSVTPALWSAIQEALDGSRHFVLLASPAAARSPWVNREIDHWLATKSADRILPVVTEGHWRWDAAQGDFTEDSTAVPDQLRGVFAEEPLFLDLRWARDDQHLTLQHSRFRDAIAQLAAPMHGISKDDLEGEDVRQHRRTRRLRSGAVAALALLTAVALLSSTLAVRNADRATVSASEARRQQQAADQQRGTAQQATAEAQRQQASATEQQARARDAAAETERQQKRSRDLQATADRAAVDARRHQEQARRAKADSGEQQKLADRQRALAEQQEAVAKDQRRLAQQATRENKRQQIIAAEQQRLAEEAAVETGRQKAIARQQQVWAEQATAEARRQEAVARAQEKRAQQAAEEARRQKESAARQEQIAVSRRLINEAKMTMKSEPGKALHLGLAARSIQPGEETNRELAALITSTHHAGVINAVYYADFGVNGVLTTVNDDYTVSFWNVADRAHPVRIAHLDSGQFGGEPVFSADRRTLALVDLDADGEIVFFDVSNPARPVRVGSMPAPSVSRFQFSQDGKTLVLSTLRQSWQLWDVTDLARPRWLSERPMEGYFLTIAPDGRTVVTQDQPATVWSIADRANPARIATLDTRWLGALAFSPRQAVLATNDFGAHLVLWDLSNPRVPRKIISFGQDVNTLRFSVDGGAIATTDSVGMTTLWDVSDPLHSFRTAELPDDTGTFELAFSPDGRTLVTIGDNRIAAVRNVATYGEPTLLGQAEQEGQDSRFAALAPDGRSLMTAYSDGTATIWDMADPASPRPRTSLRLRPDSLSVAAVAPNGTIVASVPDDPVFAGVALTDISDPDRPADLAHLPVSPIVGVMNGGELAFSPDGRTLAAAEEGVMVWDLTDPRRPRQLSFFNGRSGGADFPYTSAIAFSPDGHRLAVGNGKVISLWDLSDLEEPVRTVGWEGDVGVIKALAFSPDGKLLAAGGGDDKASLWSVADSTPPRRLSKMTGHSLPVSSVVFAPDGRSLLTTSIDGDTLVWDVGLPANPIRLVALRRTSHTPPWILFDPLGRPLDRAVYTSMSLLFDRDGRLLLTGTGRDLGRTWVLVWNFSDLTDLVADPVRHACAISGGGFTPDEWSASLPGLPYQRSCPS